MANVSKGGFRVVKGPGIKGVLVRDYDVATANATAIFRGDLIKQLSTGTADVAAAADANLLGVCVGVQQYLDAGTGVVRGGRFLPASTAYTKTSQRSIIKVAICTPHTMLEGDCAAATATTYAGWLAFLGENCDITATAGSTTSGQSGHCINDAGHVATAKQLRLQTIPNVEFQDFASTRVKLWVTINQSHLYTTAGV